MSEQNLTAGVTRTLTRVREQLQNTPESPFTTLLRSLLDDEGRATEILRAAGVSAAALPPIAEDAPSFLDWRRALVRRADQFALQIDSSSQTATEHLLLAAIDLHPATAEFLSRYEVTLERVLDSVAVAPPELPVPDESLVQLRPANSGLIDESGLFRILDASANRAREGLRVVEDYVRFRLNDPLLCGELKAIRHQLTATLIHLGQPHWAPSRDSQHDVGTLSDLASERFRGNLADVLRASLKRVEEALRSLEEYSKLLDAALSLQISACRYRMYTVEKALEATLQTRQRLQNCQLYLLLTAADCRYGAEATIRHSIEKGVDIVQIREKAMPDRQLLEYAAEVREWTAPSGTLLIINDRPDIAAAVGADGVHLGQDDLTVAAARQVLGGRGLIGVSTHAPEQARQAVFDGADYLGVGPVFPSSTKEFSEFPGLTYVQNAAERLGLPWFAIGGIQLENLEEVLAAGATRVAVSSAIARAPHPRGVAAAFKEKLQRPRHRTFTLDAISDAPAPPSSMSLPDSTAT